MEGFVQSLDFYFVLDVDESIDVLGDSVNAYGSTIEADQNSERSVHPEVGVKNLSMCTLSIPRRIVLLLPTKPYLFYRIKRQQLFPVPAEHPVLVRVEEAPVHVKRRT